MLLTYLDVIAISYPPRVRVRATVKLSAVFFHEESSITKWGEGGYKSAILAPLLTYLLTLGLLTKNFQISWQTLSVKGRRGSRQIC